MLPAPLNISPSLEKICPRSDMSNPAPPSPNGSAPWPESGSFLGLSRSGSSPELKPKGRSDMPSTVLIVIPPRGWVGHAESEPTTEPYRGHREQADSDPAGGAGADCGVRRVAVRRDGSLRRVGSGAHIRHARRGRGQGGRRH